jgi:twitching motility two-component system response regulator PilG
VPQPRTIPPPSARPGPRARGGTPRVLVVDDSQICLDMMAMVLEEGGYEVVTLSSPFALSSAMSEHDPDLVLVDVAMPGLPGDKLVEITMRNRRAGRGCPIVLHSDRTDAELEYLVQTSGASGHLRKTSDSEAILRGIARFVAPRR